MKNIPIAQPIIGEKEIQAVINVMRTGQLAQGEVVTQFENEFSQHFGHDSAAAISNGTTALHVALKAAGVKAGDLVLTTPFTFVATTNAILYCDAIPVFVDIDEQTFNLSPEALRKAIAKHPEARYLLLVHLFGQACDMGEILNIAEEFDLTIIEDCAQAHGAKFNSKPVGTFGKGGTFSFYPTKNMSTGEGGMIVSDSSEFISDCKLLINHGSKERYVHEVLGYNYRMTNMAAAIGIEQLAKIDQMNHARRLNAEYYHKHINNKLVDLPKEHIAAYHVYHQFTLKSEYRDELLQYLKIKGISSAVYYPSPLYEQAHIRDYLNKKDRMNPPCPIAETVSKKVIAIPVHPSLTETDLEYICYEINHFSI